MIEVRGETTVLTSLFWIKEHLDGTLTFRFSCRSAVCGSCAMTINGHQKLACKTRVYDEVERHGRVAVGPLRNMRVIKDLAVDMGPFWEKIRQVTPYLEPHPGQIERFFPPEKFEGFHQADLCIMCGACVSACTSLEVSRGFLGPAALAKAYRFVADPRDGAKQKRLEELQGPNGIWDCTRCNFCVEVCPKDVRPMEQIIRLRRISIQEGYIHTVGARHITQFVEIIKDEGRLNEARQPLKMIGADLKGLKRILPLGLKMWMKGKMHFPFKRSIRGIKEVRRIFAEMEKKK